MGPHQPPVESEAFDATWLALREPTDHRARAHSLLPTLKDRWAYAGWTKILDLGSGTGSNLRYLSPRLPTPQEWILLDKSPELLELAGAEWTDADVTVTHVVGDLAKEGLEHVAGAHLVTASALLDLVSESWLRAVASLCRAAGCGALFGLTYDGQIHWGSESAPPASADPLDALIQDAVNAHQLRDKGLGPSLGPSATRAAEALFRGMGYVTAVAASPWVLGPEDVELVAALIEGWEGAALEERRDEAREIHAWSERKRHAIREAPFTVTVGHLDLLALPELRNPELG